jgi:hypothetical protein
MLRRPSTGRTAPFDWYLEGSVLRGTVEAGATECRTHFVIDSPESEQDILRSFALRSVAASQSRWCKCPPRWSAHSLLNGEELWQVRRTRLPRLRRACSACGAGAFEPTGRFRVNANGKLLDVWLLLRCESCGHAGKVTVLERASIQEIAPAALERFHENDADLTAETLLDPNVARRNRVTLDWSGSWELVTHPGESGSGSRVVHVEFLDPVPVHPAKLIAQGLGMSRREVERRIADGRIGPAAPLGSKTSKEFEFTFVADHAAAPDDR